MLQSHKDIFHSVTVVFNCHIYIKQPNELSDWYIGKGGYAPRNELCRAMTADNGAHFYKGLVVNPETSPDAFLPSSLDKAKRYWKDFEGSMPPGFAIDNFGPFKGLVKYFGKALHTDYKVIQLTGNPKTDGFDFFDEVKDCLNEKFGLKMITHSAEQLWQEEVSIQPGYIWMFEPAGDFQIIEASTLKF